METTNRTEIRFRPASREEIGQRAKAVSRWLGLKHTEAISYLAELYGYESVRALQAGADEVERGAPGIAAGPYRRDDDMGEGDATTQFLILLGQFRIRGPGPTIDALAKLVVQWPEVARALYGVGRGPQPLLDREPGIRDSELEGMVASIWLHDLWGDTRGTREWMREAAQRAGVALIDLNG